MADDRPRNYKFSVMIETKKIGLKVLPADGTVAARSQGSANLAPRAAVHMLG